MSEKLARVNVGCGQTPTPGWQKYDNSLSIRIAKRSLLVGLLGKTGIFTAGTRSYLSFAKNADIRWADATRHIPLGDKSAEVVYSSHMVEHLDRDEVAQFLREAHRVLAPGGVIRVVVPDLKMRVHQYVVDGDADKLMERIRLSPRSRRTFTDRIRYLATGDRQHMWMYDGPSLVRVLSAAGFRDAVVLQAGETTIRSPGALDLCERADESVYVEARK